MNTVVDYIKQEQRTLKEFSFNAVDALVLCCASYFNIGRSPIIEYNSANLVSFQAILNSLNLNELIKGTWLQLSQEAPAFYEALKTSKRYETLSCAYLVHEYSDKLEKQFDAVSFFAPDMIPFVSLQGTDGSFAGWKEDFNLCTKEVLPSHRAAQRYISGVASSFEGSFIMGGHSKGGNLAEYTALCCHDKLYARIEALYNFDGPGFLSPPSPRYYEEDYYKKLHKIIPNTSIFGLLMEERNRFQIAKSFALPLASHAPLTWLVENDNFLDAQLMDQRTLVFVGSANDWLMQNSIEDRALFIDTLHDIICSTDMRTWDSFYDNLFESIKSIVTKTQEISPELRSFLLSTLAQGLFILITQTIKSLIPFSEPYKLEVKDPTKEDAVPVSLASNAVVSPPVVYLLLAKKYDQKQGKISS